MNAEQTALKNLVAAALAWAACDADYTAVSNSKRASKAQVTSSKKALLRAMTKLRADSAKFRKVISEAGKLSTKKPSVDWFKVLEITSKVVDVVHNRKLAPQPMVEARVIDMKPV